jgi:hypothetical protein
VLIWLFNALENVAPFSWDRGANPLDRHEHLHAMLILARAERPLRRYPLHDRQ